MPADDVSDLRDVFDAINKLCETMKTSNYEERTEEAGDGLVSPTQVRLRPAEVHSCVRSPDDAEIESVRSQFVSAEDLSIQRMETQRQKWRESQASLASSEVSAQRDAPPEERWSDTLASPPSCESAARWAEGPASPPEDADTEPAAAACEPTSDLYYTASSEVSLASEPEAGAECVPAGHVAAMRERFESMTRAHTPSDAPQAASPAADLCRTVTPSPDLLR